jgi:hypothetical protein
MGGVDVSARSTALPFTTTVFADENGEYVFPALAAGSYKIWAQAEGLAVERAEVELDDASTAIVIETQRDDRDFFSTLHPMFLTPALQQIHRPDRTATRRDGNIERLRKMLTKEDTYFGLRRVESYSFILLPVGYLAAECRTMPTPT